MNTDPGRRLNVMQAVPFFMATDMERSLRFYIDGVGFAIKESWMPRGSIEWCLLGLDTVSLMLQEYREPAPTRHLGVGVTIAFICVDSLKIYQELLERGLGPDEPFVGNSQWVVTLKDPDNYTLLFESPTDVAEETTYRGWIGKARD